MRIFAGFPGEGASNNGGVIENVDFRAFGRYVFGTLGNEANFIILLAVSTRLPDGVLLAAAPLAAR